MVPALGISSIHCSTACLLTLPTAQSPHLGVPSSGLVSGAGPSCCGRAPRIQIDIRQSGAASGSSGIQRVREVSWGSMCGAGRAHKLAYLSGIQIRGIPSAFCGRYRTRTDDLFRVKEARYQLRQSPVTTSFCNQYPATGSRHGCHTIGSRRRLQIQSSSTQQCGQCGCGAVVAHHLAKVRVASSNLVIRSSGKRQNLRNLWFLTFPHAVAWPRGEATACKAVYTGSNPVVTSKARGSRTSARNNKISFMHLSDWRSGSALP